MHYDVLAPNGVLFCSEECALSHYRYKDWTISDLTIVWPEDYERMREEAGPGNGPGSTCPHCEQEYHCF